MRFPRGPVESGEPVRRGGENTTVLRSLDEVAKLKEDDGGPILVHGSPTLAKGLAAAGLVDRYHPLTFPVVLDRADRDVPLLGDLPVRVAQRGQARDPAPGLRQGRRVGRGRGCRRSNRADLGGAGE